MSKESRRCGVKILDDQEIVQTIKILRQKTDIINQKRQRVSWLRRDLATMLFWTLLPVIVLITSLFFKQYFWIIWGIAGITSALSVFGFMIFVVNATNESIHSLQEISQEKEDLKNQKKEVKELRHDLL